MKRPSKKRAKPADMSAADRAVEEIRAIRRKLWKDAGGSYEGVVEIGRREGSLPSSTSRKRRKSA
jgi:hypothetical protein